MNHEGPLAETGAVVWIEDDAAAAGDDRAIGTELFGQDGVFPNAETGLAFHFEDQRDVDARALLDQAIDVHEPTRQARGERAADAALAGAHRSDESEVRLFLHDGMVAARQAFGTGADKRRLRSPPRLPTRYTDAMLRFTLLFIVLLIGLFTLELLPLVDQYAIAPFTAGIAKVCTAIVSVFDADVLTYGKVIQSTENGFAIEIERGCNGVEAMIVLAAAVLAFPAPFLHKLAGLAVGFVAIQALNVVRIISLFYLGQWSMTAFEWFHLYIWQALIILDALVVWLIWLKYLPGKGDTAPQGPVVA